LVEGFNSKDFKLHINDKLGLNQGVRIDEYLNST
jgi:hypothetical protein